MRHGSIQEILNLPNTVLLHKLSKMLAPIQFIIRQPASVTLDIRQGDRR